MFWSAFVFALILGLLLAAVFAGPIGWRHPRRPDREAGAAAALFLFWVFFLIIWAGLLWTTQPVVYGPVAWETPVIGILFWVLLVVLLVWALAPPRGDLPTERPAAPPEPGAPEPSPGAVAAAAIFGVAFWVLMILLVLAIFAAAWS